MKISKTQLSPYLNKEGNVQNYRHKPQMSDIEIVSLALCQEAMSIDSENYFWSKVRADYKGLFPNAIHLTGYNRRKKRLAPFIDKLGKALASLLNEGEQVWMTDSMPIPLCQASRSHRLKACTEHFETAPDFGYSSMLDSYYKGYKLHLVVSARGVYHSADLSKASVHDLHYLDDVKYSGLNNCTLLGDKGYLSSEKQVDLFTSVGIELETPKRRNQYGYEPYAPIFRRFRKRVETMFSQLCDQFMIKRNYAKTFIGLSARIISKLTAFTLLQYINHQNDRPLNHVKHAMAYG